jgi:hypothetical protein
MDTEKSEVGVKVLHILSQIQIFHWQTDKMGDHKTFDKFSSDFKDLGDKLLEVIQGKYGRTNIDENTYMPIRNIQDLDPTGFADQCIDLFTVYQNNFFNNDREISAIIDEILSLLQQLKYLLTFV